MEAIEKEEVMEAHVEKATNEKEESMKNTTQQQPLSYEQMVEGIGQRCLMLRIERGEGIYRAASRIGCSPQSLLDIETGKRTPRVETTKRIADHFGVPVSSLLNLPQDAA
jgi:DNA-binding XRE family transcriptional regulator